MYTAAQTIADETTQFERSENPHHQSQKASVFEENEPLAQPGQWNVIVDCKALIERLRDKIRKHAEEVQVEIVAHNEELAALKKEVLLSVEERIERLKAQMKADFSAEMAALKAHY